MAERPTNSIDPLLLPSIARIQDEGGQSVDRLVTNHAIPIIDSVLRRCQRWVGVAAIRDDVRGEVVIRLLKRFRALSQEHEAEPIESFRNYVATVTYRVLGDLMRRHFPRRAQLKNRLRYLLRHDDRFGISTDGQGATFCSLADADMRAKPSRFPNVEALASQAMMILQKESPLELNELVTALAEATGVSDEPCGMQDGSMNHFAAAPSDPLMRMETLDYLHRLWAELVLLPVRQRVALLLNLRDPAGESVVCLLPLLSISSIRQIASTLGFSDESLLAIWDRLPLQDTEIAAMLSLSRQQVINLRKAARERLHRSMARPDRRQK